MNCISDHHNLGYGGTTENTNRMVTENNSIYTILWELIRVPLLALMFVFCVMTCQNILQYRGVLSLLQQNAELGNTEAQFNLGNMYYRGQGIVLQDNIKAFKWYRKAAEQGHAGAQLILGSTYHSGTLIAKDYRKAFAWFLKAAEQGQSEAQYYLGLIYYNGEGVIRDQSKGCQLIHLAAEQGNVEAIETYNQACAK